MPEQTTEGDQAAPLQVIRIVARPVAGTDDGRTVVTLIQQTVVGAGAPQPLVVPLDERTTAPDADVVIDIPTTDLIGEPRYATTAWNLVHALQDTGAFAAVEADIPVDTFAPEPTPVAFSHASSAQRPAASEPHDWALRCIHWSEANALLTPETRGGKGIRIGHPDSGFTTHPGLGMKVIDTDTDWDIISDDPDATDPMKRPRFRIFRPIPNPGHGTSTASVIAGAGDGTFGPDDVPTGFHGVAPAATIVPYRATESVVQFFDSDVARAVRRARAAGCKIVSMSLGGTGFFGLRDAIQEAVDNGMIVMAAAGNEVRIVTAPAYYDNCLAVAATGPDDVRWSGSSRGKAVDVAAPGSSVWIAGWHWTDGKAAPVISRSDGTSHAVAHLAGIAALWLSKWGHDQLCATFGAQNVQRVFLHVLNTPGVCVRPAQWDDAWGVGRVDALAVLEAPLPTPDDLVGPSFGSGAIDDPISRLATVAGVEPTVMHSWLASRFGEADLAARARRFEGELTYLIISDPTFHASVVHPQAIAFGQTGPPAGASVELATFFQPAGGS